MPKIIQAGVLLGEEGKALKYAGKQIQCWRCKGVLEVLPEDKIGGYTKCEEYGGSIDVDTIKCPTNGCRNEIALN